MATIKGTRQADDLFGTTDYDRIYGMSGDDYLRAEGGFDVLYGGAGNDRMVSLTDMLAYGGLGNDTLEGDGQLVGGNGHDLLIGSAGDFYGDHGPTVRPTLKGGSDTLIVNMNAGTGIATQTGGTGADTFVTQMYAEGAWSEVDVLDFKPGVDKVGLMLTYTDNGGTLFQDQLFGILSGGDGVVDTYRQADGNVEVWGDVENNRLMIRVHEDYLVVDGVTSLTASDWAF